MLNISPSKLNEKVDLNRFEAVQKVFHRRHYKYFDRFLMAFAIITLIVLFLPWTQNIKGGRISDYFESGSAPADPSIPHPGAS